MLSRRAALSVAATTVIGVAASGAPAAAATVPRTFVLVHGAWHGGWAWRDVAARLRRHGHIVFTPTLTGLGERVHLKSPTIGLDSHIADIVGTIESEELERVVLVGHSYAGMVVTGAAAWLGDRIERLVYLDAIVPARGESMISRQNAQARAALMAGVSEGYIAPPPPSVFGIPASATRATQWVARRLTPQPLKTWTDALPPGELSARIKRNYIVCTDPPLGDGMMVRAADRLRATPGWRVDEIATGHDAMVLQPDRLAKLLMSASSGGTA